MHFTTSFFSGDEIAVAPSSSALVLGPQFTIETWLYLESSERGVILGRKRGSDPFSDYTIEIGNNGQLQFVESTGQPGSYRSAAAATPAPLQVWTHVAAVLDGAGIMHLYINGQEGGRQSSSGPPSSGTVPFALGTGACQACQFNGGMTGYLRQVRVWGRALSSSDLASQAGRYLTGSEPGLIAWWPLDDGGAGETARDLGINHLDLQLGTSASRDPQNPNFVRTWVADTGPYFSIEKQGLPSSFLAAYGILIDLGAGARDILTTNIDFAAYTPQPLHVLRNDGAGHFSDATATVLASQNVTVQLSDSRAMRAADFDGDGRMDILLGESGDDRSPWSGGQSRLLMQHAAGVLTDETSARLPRASNFVHSTSAGDINHDGASDLLIGNICCGSVPKPVFYVNDGSGHFTLDQTRFPANFEASGLPPPSSPLINFPAVLLADIRHQGYPDVFLGASPATGPVSGVPATDMLLLNDGSGRFALSPNALPPRSRANASTVAAVAADVDGDGWPDLILSVTDYDTPGVQLLLNNRNGTFRDASDRLPPLTALLNYLAGVKDWVSSIVPVDLNGDGLPDLVLSGHIGGVAIWLNAGNGYFVDMSDALAALPHSTGLALVGDMDGDGRPDLFTFPEFPRAGLPELYFIRQLKPLPLVAGIPSVPAAGIVNGASFAKPPLLAAGSIASLFGADLAMRTQVAVSVPLPTSLGGTSVSVNNLQAPLFFVSPGQINFQIPWELATTAQASVVVSVNKVPSNTVSLALAPAGPGVFSTNSQGTGQGAILIANTDVIAAPAGSIPGRNTRPVQRGDFISVFCNGLGAIKGTPVSGSPALGETVNAPSVTIGNVAAPVTFAGLAPGFVGLYQVNAQVPAAAPVGDAVPVTLSVGTATANTVTIAVR